jgi:hypothetical protein
MSVNTAIYGTPEEWGVANLGVTQNHADRKDSFLTAYFGGGGNTLENGYGYGVSLNTPIDKSLSYCGLGNFSTWSKIEYHKRNRDFELIGKDNRSVTNFSFNQAVKISTMTGIWYAENTSWSSTRYGSRCRFAPNAINSSAQENYNNGFIPIVQIPMKNCVLVPIFRAAKQINTDGTTTGMDVATINCWDYYGTTATRNHNTHPYILGIGFQFYTKTTDSATQRSAVSSSTSAILDELALYKNVPVDLQRPDQNILSGGYSYCWNVPQSTFAYKQIFGYVSNGTTTVSNAIDYNVNNLSTSTRQQLLRAIAIFPHENAVFSDEWAVNTTTYARYYYLQYYDGLREWVRKQIACFGLFFTDVSAAVAQSGAFDSDDMYLGILDENNIGQGFYTHGQDNRNQKQWDWETTNDSDYNPSTEIDDNIYGRSWGFNPVSLADSTVRRYVMSPAELKNLGQFLWDIIDTTDADALIQNQTLTNFLTNNPLDCVISLKYFPFNDMSQASLTNLVLGKVQIPNVAGKPFSADSVTRSCGTKHIPHRFKDWRDYVCEYMLYLPFCGTIKLDAETVVGRDIGVYYAIDYTTGTCTAYVTTWDDDGAECYIDSASGNCSIDIPLSGVETATLTGELYNANENLKALKFNGIVGAAKGVLNIAGAAGSGSKLAAAGAGLQAGAGIVNAIHDKTVAEWNISQTQIPLKMIGASSGCNSFQGELTPCVLIFYPETDAEFNKTDYLHTVGAACCESGTIGDYTGYAEIVNADLSGLAATADEINMIRNQLAKGVYL